MVIVKATKESEAGVRHSEGRGGATVRDDRDPAKGAQAAVRKLDRDD
jgi:hypothetical protein